MDDELQELIAALHDNIRKVIEQFHCEDYYEVDCKLIEKDRNFSKWKEHIVIEPEKCFCAFCNKESYYYSDKISGYVCAKCFYEVIRKDN